ncbi:hypothetical protein FF38_04924 [Lucilia cuprina]|uniref:G-protein coupled receptors family 1 profile domain-containing protein n=1 Tax=Lucilia cuprina TaxID=7375 RepID=A0A0L0C8S9_LUCCU|nr:Cholecystokinin receptor [Lucilia cuprina]KNC28655.1 hypothetical protein FF38_04924 [Lucilia cuprina]
MTITTKEFSDLLQYFSVKNASNHIISLALTVNDSFVVGFKQQSVTFEQPPWDILDGDNTSTSSLFNQYIDNSSTLQYATNDTFLNQTKLSVKKRISTEIPIWLIPCYSIILIFAIVGNLLVASTLFQNRRMRTITNVFLANLAISDMLLGVLCMPITLVGTYLRHFIFGELVCKFIQFAQAASVAVSSWTLVAISCERYYAICHPLRSRTWQTINHAYKIIGCIWFGSIVCMAPIAIFSQLIPTSRQGLRKCREQWPEEAVGYERFYNIFLDLVLLVLPLGILCVAYILITRTLYMGIKDEKALIFGNKNNNVTHGATGESKIYTQVEAEIKTPTVFNLNMSFRYQTRKGTTSTLTGSGAVAGCVNNGDALQKTNNCKETKYFASSNSSSTGAENKYSAMGSISPSAAGVVYGRRGLCHDSKANIQTETEISFKETKEQSSNLQTQSTLRQHCNDDISQFGACSIDKTGATSAMTTANRRKFMTKSNDGRQLQLYCMRSASVKSLNRKSSQNKTENQDAASSSCYSLNTMPTTHITRLQPRQSFNQKQQQLQFHQQQQQISDVVEKRKLNSMPSLRITESALRRSNLEKNLESKKRVVKMLFVLVLEFFICWTPLYVINTMAMFIGPAIYEYVDYTTISFFQLLAYSSSCCNPITYCFMNASFRRAFVDTFKGMHLNGGSFWHKSSKATTNLSVAGNSIAMANSCTVVTANTVLDSPRL